MVFWTSCNVFAHLNSFRPTHDLVTGEQLVRFIMVTKLKYRDYTYAAANWTSVTSFSKSIHKAEWTIGPSRYISEVESKDAGIR